MKKSNLLAFSALALLGACTLGSTETSSSAVALSSSALSSSATSSSALSSSTLSSSALSSSAISSSAMSSSALSSSALSSSSVAATPKVLLDCKTADTLKVEVGSFNSFECHVSQDQGTPLNVKIVRDDKSLTDAGWNASFCLGPTCYLPTAQESDFLDLQIGGTGDNFTYDVIPNSAGTQSGTLKLVTDKGVVVLTKKYTVIATNP
jgi:hypothetical protein